MAVTDPFLIAADIFDPPPPPYTGDPVGFAKDILGFDAWSKQAEILESVRDHERTAVRASHGPGKTAVAARSALAFLHEHPGNSRVVTTAPTWAQVADLLWREIRSAVGAAHNRQQLTAWPVPSATKLDLSEQWFAIGHSTDRPERFQGHHADHLLLIVDEASGVAEAIFEAAEGFLTAEGARILLLGNPTQTGGTFYRAFTSERALYNCIHISAYDCPNETGEEVPPEVARALPRKGWAQERLEAWGEDSWIYQVRVLGNFPKNTKDVVLSLTAVEEAQARELSPARPTTQQHAVVAIDVARFGDDETVISTRHDNQIQIRESYNGNDTTHTRTRGIHWWKTLREETGADPIFVIDDDGVGGGVTDMLREKRYEVVAFNAGARAIEADNYPNRRSELWFTMRRRIASLDLDGDDQLAADLVAPKFKYDSDGRRVVEPKDDTKKRLGRSPDRGDSVLLTLVRRPPLGPPATGASSREQPDAPSDDGTYTGDLLDEEG